MSTLPSELKSQLRERYSDFEDMMRESVELFATKILSDTKFWDEIESEIAGYLSKSTFEIDFDEEGNASLVASVGDPSLTDGWYRAPLDVDGLCRFPALREDEPIDAMKGYLLGVDKLIKNLRSMKVDLEMRISLRESKVVEAPPA